MQRGPLDFSRLRAKPWKNATHGRYKDIFNLQQLDQREGQRTRPMRMSPDLDFKVDKKDKQEDLINMQLAAIEVQSQKIAKEELKKVIMKQRRERRQMKCQFHMEFHVLKTTYSPVQNKRIDSPFLV